MDTTTPAAAAPSVKLPVERSVIVRLYVAGLAVVALAIFVSMRWGVEYPILQVLALGVCTWVGKLLGMPLERIYQYALQKRPEKALEVAMQALQSLPPERVEAATQELISSFPPAARSVVLVNTGEPPIPPSMPPSIP